MVTPKGDQGSGSAVHTVVLNLPLVRSWVTEASALFHVFSAESSHPAEAEPAGRALAGGRGEGALLMPGPWPLPSWSSSKPRRLGWCPIPFCLEQSSGLRWKVGILQ